ncbi:hypothetical protein I5907_08895 [Panacibacter sp. DH6]|uniref:Lipocalin-like domain-containing protein n=1 Tax=Panacibacter microcysteis TaxID=2793269 RepID=A0A931GXQ7_9BACT|nr:hypothetical protein [Panacibacter microcysteis]MBG9376349.1 hypothetical protein [Panacibacter microcysteis]
MKKAAFVFVCLAALAACRKDLTVLKDDLNGTWELKRSFSGWAGERVYEPGNGNTVRFSENTYTSVVVYADTTYTTEGTFSLTKGKPSCITEGDDRALINFDNSIFENTISIVDNELTISNTECIADGGSSTYRRIAP